MFRRERWMRISMWESLCNASSLLVMRISPWFDVPDFSYCSVSFLLSRLNLWIIHDRYVDSWYDDTITSNRRNMKANRAELDEKNTKNILRDWRTAVLYLYPLIFIRWIRINHQNEVNSMILKSRCRNGWILHHRPDLVKVRKMVKIYFFLIDLKLEPIIV